MDEQMATVLKLMAEVDEHDDESEFSSCFEWASRFDNDEGGAQALREIVEPLKMALELGDAIMDGADMDAANEIADRLLAAAPPRGDDNATALRGIAAFLHLVDG